MATARSDRRIRSASRSIAPRPICSPAAASRSAFAPASSTSAPRARSRWAAPARRPSRCTGPSAASPLTVIAALDRRRAVRRGLGGARDRDPSGAPRARGARDAAAQFRRAAAGSTDCSPDRSDSSAPASCNRRRRLRPRGSGRRPNSTRMSDLLIAVVAASAAFDRCCGARRSASPCASPAPRAAPQPMPASRCLRSPGV